MLTRIILQTVCRGGHASSHPVASLLSCCSDIPLRRRCNTAIILPHRTARKIPVTGPEQGSQGDGGDTQRIRWLRLVHRVMQARAIHGVAFVILPLPVSRRVVRRRRGKQGNQNFGPRKKIQPAVRRAARERARACSYEGRRNGVEGQEMEERQRGKEAA